MSIMTANDWVGSKLAGGRYLVTAKLGEGGMGHVYQARDRNLQVDVVVKAPRPELLGTGDVAERFAEEIRSLVQLAHPHIVRIIDVGDHRDIPFAVMQFLSGGSLEDRARGPNDTRIPLAVESLKEWLQSISEALDFIHRMNYVHRDVKPANILFDAHGNAYLGDFGVVKAVNAIAEDRDKRGLTRPGTALGTPEYMAPELIKGEPCGPASDQYSLAVTAYDLLTGRLPFEGATAAAILIKQMSGPPTSPSDLVPSIPRAVSRAILKAMSHDPAHRFESCAAFSYEVLSQLAAVNRGTSGVRGAVAANDVVAGTGSSGSLPAIRPATTLIAVRLSSPLSAEELLGEIRGWLDRWNAKILEEQTGRVKLRFEQRGGWLDRFLKKEDCFIVDLIATPAPPTASKTTSSSCRVDLTILYQGSRHATTELRDQADHILRLLKDSLLLIPFDPSTFSERRSSSADPTLDSPGSSPVVGTHVARAVSEWGDPSNGQTINPPAQTSFDPIRDALSSPTWVAPQSEAKAASETVATQSPSLALPPAPAPPVQSDSPAPVASALTPSSTTAAEPRSKSPLPLPTLVDPPRPVSSPSAVAVESAAPAPPAVPPPTPPKPAAASYPSSTPAVSDQTQGGVARGSVTSEMKTVGGTVTMTVHPGHDDAYDLECKVVRVSRKAMNLISPRKLVASDVLIRLAAGYEPHRARIIHCLPRSDGQFQVGIVLTDPPPELTRMFEAVHTSTIRTVPPPTGS